MIAEINIKPELTVQIRFLINITYFWGTTSRLYLVKIARLDLCKERLVNPEVTRRLYSNRIDFINFTTSPIG